MTLIDTDILIDTARRNEKAITYLQELEDHAELTINSITQMELIVGCQNNSELKALEKFLGGCFSGSRSCFKNLSLKSWSQNC